MTKGRRKTARKRASQNVTTASRAKRAAEIQAVEERRAVLERLSMDDFDDVDKKILGIVLAAPGTTDAEIGLVVNLTRESVNRRRHRPKFQQVIAEAQLDALSILSRNQSKAARELGNLLTNPDAGIRFRAAFAQLAPVIRKQGESAGAEGAFAAMLDAAAKYRLARDAKVVEIEPKPAAPALVQIA